MLCARASLGVQPPSVCPRQYMQRSSDRSPRSGSRRVGSPALKMLAGPRVHQRWSEYPSETASGCGYLQVRDWGSRHIFVVVRTGAFCTSGRSVASCRCPSAVHSVSGHESPAADRGNHTRDTLPTWPPCERPLRPPGPPHHECHTPVWAISALPAQGSAEVGGSVDGHKEQPSTARQPHRSRY